MLSKKLGHIILVFLLLISTAGVSINKHYSGGELFSTAIFVEADSCCETPCGCCNESTETLKLEADYLASSFELDDVAQMDLLYASIPLLMQFVRTEVSTNSFPIGEFFPPPLPDLCILNQVFRL
ncbi:hypothetical protein [Marinifilum sp. D714]|uniref:HYC_CC_PP family protein n=1 Tax=Marinifilum sp. D714 TaxID=2937523 RepID=UPI0027CA0690|nr:hypothetical protein [Marinifilum sp. D714]MDQ2178996.1 hypothetical protein [Marinifilum sp. D714]